MLITFSVVLASEHNFKMSIILESLPQMRLAFLQGNLFCVALDGAFSYLLKLRLPEITIIINTR